jgi:hypothetical protein
MGSKQFMVLKLTRTEAQELLMDLRSSNGEQAQDAQNRLGEKLWDAVYSTGQQNVEAQSNR